jgi:phosphohistidine phosphatase
MLVGHEPDFSLIISALTGGGKVILKKGGLARVDITATAPLQGDLVWLLPPKIMRL